MDAVGAARTQSCFAGIFMLQPSPFFRRVRIPSCLHIIYLQPHSPLHLGLIYIRSGPKVGLKLETGARLQLNMSQGLLDSPVCTGPMAAPSAAAAAGAAAAALLQRQLLHPGLGFGLLGVGSLKGIWASSRRGHPSREKLQSNLCRCRTWKFVGVLFGGSQFTRVHSA